jgi:23S rRNA (cytidine1920-2'-O)/16S rRNA (cytidine1409-2'-O)-methyltransferase
MKKLFVEDQREEHEAVLRPLARAHEFEQSGEHEGILTYRGTIVAMKKIRLDVLLTERGLVESRSLAQKLVMAGQVRVDDQLIVKPSVTVNASANVIIDHGPRFVSRGGEKLDAALTAFPINVSGSICADVGSSTGGFTDCLLQRGAIKVYAIDVGKGILHYKLRTDPRVIVMEETNARFVESLPEPIGFASIDASFISLKILLPVVSHWFSPLSTFIEEGKTKAERNIVALIKPQFEAGRVDVARGDGVVRDPEIHRRVLIDVLTFAQDQGFVVRGLIRSPLIGPKGNAEFLVWLSLSGEAIEIESLIAQIIPMENEL